MATRAVGAGEPGLAVRSYKALTRPLDRLIDQLRFYARAIRSMPLALQYRGMILGAVPDRISDEIDALEVMAVDSLVYMVATRIWAAIITIVPLYLAALFSSYLATEAIVTRLFALSSGVYSHYFHLFLPPIDIFYSLIKA